MIHTSPDVQLLTYSMAQTSSAWSHFFCAELPESERAILYIRLSYECVISSNVLKQPFVAGYGRQGRVYIDLVLEAGSI